MGFKQRPFMSPDMYNDIVKPGHKLTFDYAHSHDLPVVIHSCGFVEPLLPGMIEAGIDCLQVIEIRNDRPLVADTYNTLQAVFLASNRGKDVYKPPPERVAYKTFFRNWFFQNGSRLFDDEAFGIPLA